MGNGPSKPTGEDAARERAVLERVRVLSLGNDDDEYVDLDTEEVVNEKEGAFVPRLHREPEGLAVDTLNGWAQDVMKDPKNRLAVTAMSTASPRDVLKSTPVQMRDQQIFNVQIPFEGGPVTNQQRSGRCWLFASTNVFRVALMKKYRLDNFELSQAYLFYWDKLEKANWFLEQVLDTAHLDLDDRLVQTLMSSGSMVSDGGQWDMVYNLVDKYGLVPQALYPDRWSAQNSNVLNTLVKTKLRQAALALRRECRKNNNSSSSSSFSKSTAAIKRSAMKQISHIMTLVLGPPPSPQEKFTWQYADKDGKAHELRIAPREFAKDIASSEFQVTSTVIAGMISLLHDPRHEPMSLLTVSGLGNIVGGRDVTYVNVTMPILKSACVKMLKAGMPIFFGCDSGQFSDNDAGLFDVDVFDYEVGFDTSMLRALSKTQRLQTGESQMTHAMVLTAVHLDGETGNPVRWRVQNSWGEATGTKGYFVMSDAWMDEFVYQAVVDPRFVTKDVRDVMKQDPIVLPLWDPMGSLAA